jgi:hypothetical protein
MKQNDNIAVEGVSPMAFRQPVGTHAEDRTTPLVLPPKTSIAVFRQFMQRLEGIVGTENATVVSSDAELDHEDYMDPSKAHDVRRVLLIHLNLVVVVHELTDSRCIMSCQSNTSSAPP